MAQTPEGNTHSSTTGAFLTGIVAGAVIGAGLGLWFAPRSGEEMRGQIKDTARDVGQRVSKTVNDLAERGREALDRARDVIGSAGDQLAQVAAEASKAMARTVGGPDKASGERG